ncbi:hypothetical protein [Gulosibacter molinativorax]|uniref:Minor tail protein n=1 Tax=Gulosibacter molinativorax TaxID=256821 RepID=A0ABT7CE01_9MICO|nr:hypothetical protein [Gulosibacter molinativorax]MDJ1372777.1 hypothetical protein [Gulosibacter molinativorax]QUY63357.1 Hypotetical protein [Gulosibacter molinativorax]
MVERIVPVHTVTGERIFTKIGGTVGSWTTSLTTPGTGSVTIYARDQKRKLDFESVRLLRRTAATAIVIEEVKHEVFSGPGHIQYAGYVTDSEWDDSTGMLSLNLVEIKKLGDKRQMWVPGEGGPNELTITGASMYRIVREVLWRAFGREIGTRHALPFLWPEEKPGQLTYELFRYHYKSLTQVMSDLDATGGPDWNLRPRWVGGLLKWDVHIGSPTFDWGEVRMRAATPENPVRTPVSKLKELQDGSEQASDVWVIGAGSEADMRVGWAGPDQLPMIEGVPRQIVTESHKHVDVNTQLNQIALTTLLDSRGPRRQFSFELQFEQGGWLTPDMVRIGMRIRLAHPGSEGISRGEYLLYVLSVSRAGKGRVRVETQEVE